ncbi:putative type IIS restriction/modification enzyme [Planktothrix serta PCC 8927]|uniref:site-specific DNA-methyltransferase (adenine-specific) n=1 Tax=Planktothrix serta PCC 8927 TaxID=671068 RepID=A0A7Z9BX47_9CYAN|nr:TaqI-like C-terminal specificity domain-containing protein [Planktothrix serta]VXD23019.1 putative type IIS restriction/modification enzyme [Planktothrix serta PCC 8927]
MKNKQRQPREALNNDSNTLNKSFYSELLHIIGLTETKEKNKKLIKRQPEGQQNSGSLLENAILQLNSLDKISRLEKPEQFGETEQEQLFNIALELAITWINRILFLKLLESQLITYHKGNKNFAFLNLDKIHNFDDLDRLFFQILAVKSSERNSDVQKIFAHVPYLNSSLFEPTELEHQTIVISNLREDKLPILSTTVLKDDNGNKRTGELNTLQYLFEFLDAYDFSSEGLEGIQEDQKTLINASVLGLIFEKINGYKDGSYFTPGFITMYMCRETLRKAVVQKFNDIKGWNCQTLDDLYDKIEDRTEANQIINRLKICDPAVGSGHFLVSALNEIIAIKNDLKILQDQTGKRLKEYQIIVENDELIITDEDNKPFSYTPQNPESQRIQETLFHEKQTIIENCLFGVDINPNSVKICRLRLWIELLKNAYYQADSNYSELETLPNIDINIKCGNSLISRFPLDADLKPALKKNKIDIETYQNAVQTYRHAENKQQKREMEKLINTIKGNFKTTLQGVDPKKTKLRQLEGEVYNLENQLLLFEETKAEQKVREKKVIKLNNEIDKLRVEIEEIESGKIYDHAFEWRFEFPEILDDTGKFIGFDVVIGNPPYGVKFNSSEKALFSNQYSGIDDIYTIFIDQGIRVAKKSGFLALIIPIFWLTSEKYYSTRSLILQNLHLNLGVILPYNIFSDAYVDTGIYIFSKNINERISYIYEFGTREKIDYNILNSLNYIRLHKNEWANTDSLKIIFNSISRSLTNKLNIFNIKLEDITNSTRGILANQEDYSTTKLTEKYETIFVGKIDRYFIDSENFQYVNYGENIKEKPSSFDSFTGERILIRRIINRQFRIMATLTEQRFVTKKDVYIFKPNNKRFSARYLLAIINSKLISFIQTKGSTSAKKDDFTQITLNDIRQLRIPEPTFKQTDEIEKLVNKILTAKQSNPNTDTTILEQQIDQLVYELYGLTEEEIKIVEGKT